MVHINLFFQIIHLLGQKSTLIAFMLLGSHNFQLGLSILILRIVAYYLPYYLFTMKVVGRPGWDVFTIKGFRNWKNVHDGKKIVPFDSY
jgi:hypothetical protein